MGKIFITGSTGFIGKEFLQQLCGSQEEEEELLLLVRSRERAVVMLQRLGLQEQGQHIRLLRGDLSEPGLGLSAEDREHALEAEVIVHAGGPMSIELETDAAQRVFLDGARHLAEWAEMLHQRRGLRHFIHVVGFMSPFHDGNVDMEADVYRMEGFMEQSGAYERMKFLADLYLRQHARRHGYPLSVVNPSTVIGAAPAGVTEQTGGLGLLVSAVRRGVMPVIPGGASHWVPLVTTGDLARIMVRLAREKHPASRTYNILGEREASPSMVELQTAIARELCVSPPRGSLPVPLLRFLMKAGGSRLTGLPAVSLDFITDRSFRVAETAQLLRQHGLAPLEVRKVLPMVIADLDYRLTYPDAAEPPEWSRRRAGDLAALVRDGRGTPWVLVHGLLSGADDLLPLAESLHRGSGSPVWVLDLPGFGRSPSLQQGEGFAGYAAALTRALAAIPGPVRLAGHSAGAILVARAASALPGKAERLALLQPVLHRPQGSPLLRWLAASPRAGRLLLRRLSPVALTRALLREGAFAAERELPPGYAAFVVRGLASPRIAAANARMLRFLHRELPLLTPEELPAEHAVLWGGRDRAYSLPEAFLGGARVKQVDGGHHFPLSHPRETAELLLELP